MTITIDETYRSREVTDGNQPSAELRYVIQGTDDEMVVHSLIIGSSPAVFLGLRRSELRFEPLGGGVWEGAVYYAQQEQSQFTFDTGGGTQHVSQGLTTVGSFAAPAQTAPNFQGAIGVNDDQVAGTDITVPIFNFSETHYVANGLVTQSYKLTLFQLTGKVNGASFKGFAKGELLFLGASGSRRGNEDWEITFRFAASPNVAGLALGSITGISKEGWHYLWVRFTDDVNSNTLIKRPVAAYVEQVYPYADFLLLGLSS